jgi:phosphohistidine phosphatase
MTMCLWILRHGRAEPQSTDDSRRALVASGERDARAAGIWLAGAASPPPLVFASPYRRAQQTEQAVLAARPGAQWQTAAWLAPDSDPGAVLEQLAGIEAPQVLLVSHQPLVSALVGLLVDGDYRAGPPLATASLAELELSMPAAGCAVLRSLRHAPDYSRSAL